MRVSLRACTVEEMSSPGRLVALSVLRNFNDGTGTLYDLNDPTLVQGVGNSGGVLTDALAINRDGYIICRANDGKTYLMVPLTY